MNNIKKVNFIKISKQLVMDFITSKAEFNINTNLNSSLSLQPEYKDYSKCKETCPFYKLRDSHTHCLNDCTFILSKSTYNVPKNKYELSASQFKQLLYYHSIVFENNGITSNVTLKEVAEGINVDPKTVANNIKVLEKNKFIAVNKYNDNTHVVLIMNYNKYHEKNNKGGYFYISKKCFEKLVALKDVNAFRLALLMLIKIDNMKAVNRTIKKLSYKFLINILPTYIHTKKQISIILDKIKDIIVVDEYKSSLDTENVYYSENIDINNTTNNNEIEKESIALVDKYLENKKLSLKQINKVDLYQMVTQYGFNIVKNAIELNIENLLNVITDENNNVCGYIRRIIQQNFRSLILKA